MSAPTLRLMIEVTPDDAAAPYFRAVGALLLMHAVDLFMRSEDAGLSGARNYPSGKVKWQVIGKTSEEPKP